MKINERIGSVLAPLADRTDYARLDALSAAEIETMAENDGEGSPTGDEEWARAEIRQPIKKTVGLKLDDDVLARFKSHGRGHQTRIDAVLRRYVEARRRTGLALAAARGDLHKAWRLVYAPGCRGLTLGEAQVCELHGNFLLNRGGATAAEIEALSEDARRRARDTAIPAETRSPANDAGPRPAR